MLTKVETVLHQVNIVLSLQAVLILFTRIT
jgi:hypothetical protein